MKTSPVRDAQGFYALPPGMTDLLRLLVPRISETSLQMLQEVLDIVPPDALSIDHLAFLPERQATTVLAAIEIARRLFHRPVPRLAVIDSPAEANKAFSEIFRGKHSEHFAVLFLDVKNRVRDKTVVSIGSWTETLVPISEILRLALLKQSSRLIVAHNHPSGSTDPSPEDLAVTKELFIACQSVGIKLLDHLVVTDRSFTSIRQEGGVAVDWPA